MNVREPEPSHLAIVGAGSWGTVLAHLNTLAGKRVRLWCRSLELAYAIDRERRNQEYLPDLRLDPRLDVTTDLQEALDGAASVILAVPTSAIREVSGLISPLLNDSQTVICAAKGFEYGTGFRMSEVLAQALPTGCCAGTAALSGPNLAMEIAHGHPATSVIASIESSVARSAAAALQCPNFRVYTNSDLVGVEFGGALKNVVAIGAGVIDGLGLGQNAKAALITRGLAEMTRLGVAAGAHPLTFAGLSGLGDLVATCSSESSRNHYVGEQLARGRSWPDIAAGMHVVAEGVNTTRVARELGRRYGVHMPIAEQTHAILFEGRDIREAMRELLERAQRDELEDLSAWSELPAPPATAR